MQPNERREHRRFKAHFAVVIDGEEKKGRIGVSHDANARGLLFNTCSRFAPSDSVKLTLLALPGAPAVRARLVRIQEVRRDSAYPWRYLAAAVFDEPLPELEAVVESTPVPMAHLS